MSMNHADELEIREGITPDEYFLEYLPKYFDKNKNSVGISASDKIEVAFELTGKGGGVWTLIYIDGRFSVRPGDSESRVVKILQKLEDWQSGLFGKKGFSSFSEPDAVVPVSVGAYLSDYNVEKMKDLKGAIKLKLIEQNRNEWNMILIFGHENRPQSVCTVTMDVEDVENLRSRKVDPQDAFMAGKIKIHGDIALAMKIGNMFEK